MPIKSVPQGVVQGKMTDPAKDLFFSQPPSLTDNIP